MFYLELLLIFVLTLFLRISSGNEFTCGKKFISTGLIIGGTFSGRGQWPWMSALYLKSTQSYFCGGNLISVQHVLTAAHCIHPKDTPTRQKSEEIEVLLGKYDLSKNVEAGSARRDVRKIIVHEDWNFLSMSYDADIAILILNEAVRLTEYITPVCLPTARVNAPIDSGTIVR